MLRKHYITQLDILKKVLKRFLKWRFIFNENKETKISNLHCLHFFSFLFSSPSSSSYNIVFFFFLFFTKCNLTKNTFDTFLCRFVFGKLCVRITEDKKQENSENVWQSTHKVALIWWKSNTHFTRNYIITQWEKLKKKKQLLQYVMYIITRWTYFWPQENDLKKVKKVLILTLCVYKAEICSRVFPNCALDLRKFSLSFPLAGDLLVYYCAFTLPGWRLWFHGNTIVLYSRGWECWNLSGRGQICGPWSRDKYCDEYGIHFVPLFLISCKYICLLGLYKRLAYSWQICFD